MIILKPTHQYGRNDPCPIRYYIWTFRINIVCCLHNQSSLWCPLANLWRNITEISFKKCIMLDTNHFSHWYWPHHGFYQFVSFKRRPLINTLKPRQNVDHFTNDIFKCIFLNVWILIKISLKSVLKGPNNSIPALIQIMAWRRPDDKPLFEPMLVSLLTHICVTGPQWANRISKNLCTLFTVSPNGRYHHFPQSLVFDIQIAHTRSFFLLYCIFIVIVIAFKSSPGMRC